MFSSRDIAKVFTGAAAIALLIGTGVAGAQTKSKSAIADDDMGIRKGSLMTEEKVTPEQTVYPKAEAGRAKNINRSFENSPALIPHDTEGILPITLKNNRCLECHMPDAAKAAGATPVPHSHLMKLAAGQDLQGKLDNERFNCVECHVRQTKASPPVENTFRGGFKSSREKTRSNLADTVNEGVKGE